MKLCGRRVRSLLALILASSLALAVVPVAWAAEPPPNDEVEGATPIAVPSSTSMDASGATVPSPDSDTIDPACFAGERLGATVWFTFTTGPETYGFYYIDTFGSDYDTTVAIFVPGQSFDYGYCYYDSKGTLQTYVEHQVYPDSQYYIMVGSKDEATPGGNLVLNVTDVAPPPPPTPPNDEIQDATEIDTLPFRDALDVSLATQSETDPVPYGDFGFCGAGLSVWYRFTPSSDVHLQIDTIGSEYRNTLTVYQGSPGSLEQIAGCDSDGAAPEEVGPWVEFTASAGTTYHVLVSSYPRESAGFLVFNAREIVPFTIDVTVASTGQVHRQYGYVIASATITCSRFGYVGLTGQLVQQSGRRNAYGSFFEPVACGEPMPWDFLISPAPESPDGFGVGRATLHLEATGESHGSIDVVVIDKVIQLRAIR